MHGNFPCSTYLSTGVTLVNSGAQWQQSGSVSITLSNVASDANGVQLKAGTTWNQDGPTSIQVTASSTTGYGVYFNTGGTWNQNNGANITTSTSGAGTYVAIAKQLLRLLPC
jgi:hypothetical protein